MADVQNFFGREFANLLADHTEYALVDFYQYIKGVEYLICVAFFVGFPMFYRYINNSPEAGAPKTQ